jgi:hypothetical protein
VFDRYEAQWKEYAGTYVISDLEEDRNSWRGQVFDLRNAKLENLKNSLRSTFNTDLFGAGTSNGSKVFTGLQALVSVTPTTGTVQAVDRSSTRLRATSRPRARRRPRRSTTCAPRCGRSTTSRPTASPAITRPSA